MNKSQRQIDIIDKWNNSTSNILINAIAGAGKTTILLELLSLCNYKTLFLAYNKAIQEDIQKKIEDNNLKQGKALTLHSVGLMSIKESYKKVVVNNSKNYDLLKQLQDNEKVMFKKIRWEERLKLIYTLMDVNDVSRIALTDDLEEIKDKFLEMDKLFSEHRNLSYLWRELVKLREESYNSTVIEIDFHDMLYLPVIKHLHIPLNPRYLFIDEAQDLSLLQHKLIQNIVNQGDVKRLVIVGDRNQSIYAFNGATSKSFDLFLQYPNTVEMPLDICYRCPVDIISKANEVYNCMKAFKTDLGIVKSTSDVNSIKENSMVICRNNSPLVDLYFQLLSLSKPCYIKGEEILSAVLRFLKPYDKYTIDAAKEEMESKMIDLSLDNTDKGRIKFFIFKENYLMFKKMSEHLAARYDLVSSMTNKIKSLFIDKKNAIMLCTIHKSKGLEADVVYILNEDLIPSKFAKSPEQLKQEKNLKYVARTRAMKELYFLNI